MKSSGSNKALPIKVDCCCPVNGSHLITTCHEVMNRSHQCSCFMIKPSLLCQVGYLHLSFPISSDFFSADFSADRVHRGDLGNVPQQEHHAT